MKWLIMPLMKHWQEHAIEGFRFGLFPLGEQGVGDSIDAEPYANCWARFSSKQRYQLVVPSTSTYLHTPYVKFEDEICVVLQPASYAKINVELFDPQNF